MTPMCRTGIARLAARYTLSLWAVFGTALTAFSGGITIDPQTPAPGRWTVSSPAYRMEINLDSPRIESFTAGDYALVKEGLGLAPTINTGAPWGPAKAAVALQSAAVTHIVLYGMRWEDDLTGAIEVHFFCYPDRVVARMDIIPHAPPPTLLLGWYGTVAQAGPFPDNASDPDWHDVFGVRETLGPAAVLLRPIRKGPERERGAHIRIEHGKQLAAHYVFNAHDIGTRRIACTLVAARDEDSLVAALARESAARRLECTASNGRYLGYDRQSGLHRFVMKPGTEMMTISAPSVNVATRIAVAVAAQSRDAIRVQGPDGAVPVDWMPRTFSETPSDGPGAYVFNVDLGPSPQTLTLVRNGARSQ